MLNRADTPSATAIRAAVHSARADTAALRAVRRAVLDARGGLPVLIEGPAPLIVLPAETAHGRSLTEFSVLSAGDPMLVLAASRAAALVPGLPAEGPAVALQLGRAPVTPERLMVLADPTRGGEPGPIEPARLPQVGEAALMLAKLGRLLPAILVAAPAPEAAGALLHVSATAIRAYPAEAGATLAPVAEARVPLAEAAEARMVAFRPADGGTEHIAVLIGTPETAEAPLVRIHSECFTGDLMGSLRCDCGPQLHHAIQRMAAEGAGVLLYMAQEGRGIGLVNKLRAYALQDAGLDTLDANRALGWGADERTFAPAATMLKALGIGRIRLLTNNPDKLAGLAAHGIEVAGRVGHAIAANGVNDAYLETKARRFGHLL